MKYVSYFLLVVLVLAGTACGNRGKSKENITALEPVEADAHLKKTTVQFTETEHDFGQVKEGEKVVHSYEFKNTGNADLILLLVKPSCGCTTPKYDRSPIQPGKTGSIEVVFDTKNKPGKQHKNVAVTTNTEPPTTVLSFTCEVLRAEEKK